MHENDRVCFQPITTLNCCTTCISWEIGSYNTQQSAIMNIRTFVAILSRNPQHDFPKMRGGGQRPFGTFPKIHPFWYGRPSLIEKGKGGYIMEYIAGLHGIMAVKKYRSDICTVCKLILSLLWLSATRTLQNFVLACTMHCRVSMSAQTCATIYGLCV